MIKHYLKHCFLLLTFLACANFAFAQTDVPAENLTENVADSDSPKSLPERLVGWYTENLNYGTIALLMVVESSFIPFPSEVVIPPAAYAACNPENKTLYVTESKFVNISLVILAGTLGALGGALINYVLAFFLGRPVINWFANSRFGSACLIDQEKVDSAEKLFVKYGIASTFFGRLIPGVRQLISIPAGLAKMRLLPFVIFTVLGATIWNVVLAILGYCAHGKQNVVNEYASELSWAILACATLFGLFLLYKFFFAKKH